MIDRVVSEVIAVSNGNMSNDDLTHLITKSFQNELVTDIIRKTPSWKRRIINIAINWIPFYGGNIISTGMELYDQIKSTNSWVSLLSRRK